VAKLYFYYAAMNAGKSTTLLQADFNYRERGMETMLWTAKLDDRAGAGVIGSRIALSAPAHVFDESVDLFDASDGRRLARLRAPLPGRSARQPRTIRRREVTNTNSATGTVTRHRAQSGDGQVGCDVSGTSPPARRAHADRMGDQRRPSHEHTVQGEGSNGANSGGKRRSTPSAAARRARSSIVAAKSSARYGIACKG